MEKLEKLKTKYPIGSILKHKHCHLFYEVVEYEFRPAYTVGCSTNRVYGEEWVHLKILFYPKDKIGTIKVIHTSYLRELELSSLEYVNRLLERGVNVCPKS